VNYSLLIMKARRIFEARSDPREPQVYWAAWPREFLAQQSGQAL